MRKGVLRSPLPPQATTNSGEKIKDTPPPPQQQESAVDQYLRRAQALMVRENFTQAE